MLCLRQAQPTYSSRTAMIRTLLKDVATGMDFATSSAMFAAKMHALKYQQPHAAPRVGNIADAEKIVASWESPGRSKGGSPGSARSTPSGNTGPSRRSQIA